MSTTLKMPLSDGAAPSTPRRPRFPVVYVVIAISSLLAMGGAVLILVHHRQGAARSAGFSG